MQNNQNISKYLTNGTWDWRKSEARKREILAEKWRTQRKVVSNTNILLFKDIAEEMVDAFGVRVRLFAD